MTANVTNKSVGVRPAKFAHIVIRTNKYEQMIDWYQNVLLAWPVFRNERLAFLTYDDEHHRIALVNMGDAPDPKPQAVGVDHIAYTYANLDDLVHTYVRLRDAGVRPAWVINHGPTTSMYFADPDGNRVELQIDNFASIETLNEWFATPAFANNPIGVEFDPEELLRRYEGGLDVTDLQDREAMASWQS